MNLSNNLHTLINDLKQAEKVLSEFTGGYSGMYISSEDFHLDLRDSINKLENGNTEVINELWIWFAPTSHWDNFVGDVALGEKIFQQLNKLR